MTVTTETYTYLHTFSLPDAIPISELPTPMIAPTSETNERRISTTMSDRGEFAIGPGAAKRMRACAWPSIRPPTANLTAMGEGAWERRPFIVSADDRAT